MNLLVCFERCHAYCVVVLRWLTVWDILWGYVWLADCVKHVLWLLGWLTVWDVLGVPKKCEASEDRSRKKLLLDLIIWSFILLNIFLLGWTLSSVTQFATMISLPLSLKMLQCGPLFIIIITFFFYFFFLLNSIQIAYSQSSSIFTFPPKPYRIL